MDGIECVDGVCVNALTGAKFSVATWNGKGMGRQLCSSEGGQLLRTWLKRKQPTVLVVPEVALPAGRFARSRDYVKEFRRFATEMGYIPYWTHPWTVQARSGVAILVQTGIEVISVRRGLDLDGAIQFEGRVLAIQLQGLWVLGLYVPHDAEQYEHLLEQAAAWIQRQE